MHPIVQIKKYIKLYIEISAEPLELVVLLPYKYIVHFECIDNKHKLCLGCLTNYELEKEGYYILLKTPRKRRKQEVNVDLSEA